MFSLSRQRLLGALVVFGLSLVLFLGLGHSAGPALVRADYGQAAGSDSNLIYYPGQYIFLEICLLEHLTDVDQLSLTSGQSLTLPVEVYDDCQSQAQDVSHQFYSCMAWLFEGLTGEVIAGAGVADCLLDSPDPAANQAIRQLLVDYGQVIAGLLADDSGLAGADYGQAAAILNDYDQMIRLLLADDPTAVWFEDDFGVDPDCLVDFSPGSYWSTMFTTAPRNSFGVSWQRSKEPVDCFDQTATEDFGWSPYDQANSPDADWWPMLDSIDYSPDYSDPYALMMFLGKQLQQQLPGRNLGLLGSPKAGADQTWSCPMTVGKKNRSGSMTVSHINRSDSNSSSGSVNLTIDDSRSAESDRSDKKDKDKDQDDDWWDRWWVGVIGLALIWFAWHFLIMGKSWPRFKSPGKTNDKKPAARAVTTIPNRVGRPPSVKPPAPEVPVRRRRGRPPKNPVNQ